MRRIKLFEEFQNELSQEIADYLKKVQIFSSLQFQDAELEIGDDMKGYWKDFYDENDFDKIDKKLPLLFWRNPERSQNLYKKGDLPPKNLVYNTPLDFDPGKVDLAKKVQKQGVDWYPKSVFDKADVDQLRFPIIAKKDDSYQSKGVEKIDTKKDLGNKKFDLYQECVPIENEYRVMSFKGNNDPTVRAFGLWLRSPNNGKSKSLRINEGEQKSKFVWTPVDMKSFEHWDQVKPIVKAIYEIYPNLNILGSDIAVDGDGKVWCIEHNETPGLVGNAAIRMYKYIFEDCFGKKMSPAFLSHLKGKGRKYFNFYKDYDYVEIPDKDLDQMTDLEAEIIF